MAQKTSKRPYQKEIVHSKHAEMESLSCYISYPKKAAKITATISHNNLKKNDTM